MLSVAEFDDEHSFLVSSPLSEARCHMWRLNALVGKQKLSSGFGSFHIRLFNGE